MGQRLQEIRADLVVLTAGVAVLLIWAGIIGSFMSQYHEPILPYVVKIGFGTLQLAGTLVILMQWVSYDFAMAF